MTPDDRARIERLARDVKASHDWAALHFLLAEMLVLGYAWSITAGPKSSYQASFAQPHERSSVATDPLDVLLAVCKAVRLAVRTEDR